MQPKNFAPLAVLAGILLLVVAGWAFRWQAIELHPSGDNSAGAILMNRWTGDIRYVEGRAWIAVPELKRK